MRVIMVVIFAMAFLASTPEALAGPILCPQPPTQPDGPCEPPPTPKPTPTPDPDPEEPEPIPPVDKEPAEPSPYAG